MLKVKHIIPVLLASLLSLAIAPAVLAGSSFDVGNAPGYPPAGSVNWTAWHDGSMLPGGYPNQVMTEDSTNSSLGPDQGYSNYGGLVRWVMIVSNYNAPAAIPGSSVVTILLGGLGSYSGSLWSDSFTWITNAGHSTDQGTATAFSGTPVCPTLASLPVSGTKYELEWNGPAGKYHIYRSQNGSGAFNGHSNGRYLYLATTNSDPSGHGVWTDNTTFESWYIVIHATSGGAIDGCHSEPVGPTAVTLAQFSAAAGFPQPLVALQWNTLSEVGLLGFNLYRADELNGERLKLNAALIPARYPGQLRGEDYSYDDLDVRPWQSYYYWIEAVKMDGPNEALGPQAVTLAGSLFMPLVYR